MLGKSIVNYIDLSEWSKAIGETQPLASKVMDSGFDSAAFWFL